MIDMVIVNSWVLYRRDALHLQLPKSEVIPVTFFIIKVAFSLITSGKECIHKRGGPSLSDTIGASPTVNKVGRPQSLPDHPTRCNRVGHWPAIEEQRRMCKKKGCNRKQVIYVPNAR